MIEKINVIEEDYSRLPIGDGGLIMSSESSGTSTSGNLSRLTTTYNDFYRHKQKNKIKNAVEDEYLGNLIREGIEPNPGPKTAKPNKKQLARRKGNGRPQNRNPMVMYQTVQEYVQRETLDYDLITTPFNNTGSSITSETWQLNDAYDPITSILTDTVQFINYRFQLYDYCIVEAVTIRFTFDNLEQFPVHLYFFAGPNPVTSALASRTSLQSTAGTVYKRWSSIMSEQYGKKSQQIMTLYLSPATLTGNPQEYFGSGDNKFTASANPAKIVFGTWVAASGTGNNLVNGITLHAQVRYHVKFFAARVIPAPLLFTRNLESEVIKSRINPEKRNEWLQKKISIHSPL